jgi:hypothetical protein
MEQTAIQQKDPHGEDSKTITIKVNNHPVVFQDHKATGLEIKRIAIQQNIHIKEDFNLFRVNGAGKLDPINDNETVTLHEGEEFRATAPDDNS